MTPLVEIVVAGVDTGDKESGIPEAIKEVLEKLGLSGRTKYLRSTKGIGQEVAEGENIDLVILDSDNSGEPLTKLVVEMKAEPSLAEAAFITLTSSTDPLLPSQLYQLGCGYLQKPFDLDDLESMILSARSPRNTDDHIQRA